MPARTRRRNYEVWCEKCGCKMALRDGKFGEFWGCTGYPQCRNTKTKVDAAIGIIEGTNVKPVNGKAYGRPRGFALLRSYCRRLYSNAGLRQD